MTLSTTQAERAALETLRLVARLATDQDVIRLALHNLAAHYELSLDPRVFEYIAVNRRRSTRERGVGCKHGSQPGKRCRECDAEIKRSLADYRLDQLEGKFDAAGFTPAERAAQKRRARAAGG